MDRKLSWDDHKEKAVYTYIFLLSSLSNRMQILSCVRKDDCCEHQLRFLYAAIFSLDFKIYLMSLSHMWETSVYYATTPLNKQVSQAKLLDVYHPGKLNLFWKLLLLQQYPKICVSQVMVYDDKVLFTYFVKHFCSLKFCNFSFFSSLHVRGNSRNHAEAK